MATEAYQAQNNGELSINPLETQLIAIKKISPDAKWSYGESYVRKFLIYVTLKKKDYSINC